MIILLCILVIIALCSCLIYTDSVWYDKKHGMKYTLTDSSFTAEWDFSSPLTMLKLTKLFIQGELDTEKRRKYIRQYNRLKESLKDKYDMSDFPDYKDWDGTKMKEFSNAMKELAIDVIFIVAIDVIFIVVISVLEVFLWGVSVNETNQN